LEIQPGPPFNVALEGVGHPKIQHFTQFIDRLIVAVLATFSVEICWSTPDQAVFIAQWPSSVVRLSCVIYQDLMYSVITMWIIHSFWLVFATE